MGQEIASLHRHKGWSFRSIAPQSMVVFVGARFAELWTANPEKMRGRSPLHQELTAT
jgi:hypothetical protein